MGSGRQGDEAAVLVIDDKVAIVSCVRFSDGKPESNRYFSWASRQAYQYGVGINWYAVEEREGKHTARVEVFRIYPEAQAAIVDAALEQASSEKPWLRTFMSFRAQAKKLVLA